MATNHGPALLNHCHFWTSHTYRIQQQVNWESADRMDPHCEIQFGDYNVDSQMFFSERWSSGLNDCHPKYVRSSNPKPTGHFGSRRQTGVSRIVVTTDKMRPYLVLWHSKFQCHGCLFTPPPPVYSEPQQLWSMPLPSYLCVRQSEQRQQGCNK